MITVVYRVEMTLNTGGAEPAAVAKELQRIIKQNWSTLTQVTVRELRGDDDADARARGHA